MCNHSLHPPHVRLSHCATVLEAGLYSACPAIELIDGVPSYESTFQRAPAYKPSLEPIGEDEEPPSDICAAESIRDVEDDEAASNVCVAESIWENEDPPSDMSTVGSIWEDEDPPSDTSTVGSIWEDEDEEPPRDARAFSPFPSDDNPPTRDEAPPTTPTAADRLLATTIRWQLEDEERRARELREARRPWAARKFRRGVKKVREARKRWMQG